MTRRVIRLKETEPGTDRHITPTPAYLATTDGTLPANSYRVRGTPSGFLDTGIPTAAAKHNIWVLGGSFVESIYAHEQHRFVSHAARTLTDVNILNGGYSGMTTLQLSLVVTSKIIGLAKPGDVVIAFSPQSDSVATTYPGGYWTGAGDSLYTPIQPPRPVMRRTTDRDYHAIVSGMEATLTALGITLVLATSPHRPIDYASDTWLHAKRSQERWLELDASARRIDKWARDAAAELGIPLIDMQSMFGDDATLFYDEYHLNSKGQAVIGERFTSILQGEVLPLIK